MNILLKLLAFLSLLLMIDSSSANAQQGHHGQGHNEMHDWYQGLTDKKGASCCNQKDCRATQSRVVDEKVQVLLDGEWIPVPQDKIINRVAPDMGTHVCAPKWPDEGNPKGTIFCVILGFGV